MAAAGGVTVRITVLQQGGTRCVALAGRLTGEEVGALEEAIGDDRSAVRLDLEDLRSADADGLGALRRLRAEGVELRNVPPHLEWRIETDEP